MKRAILVVAMSLMLAVPAFAAGGNQPSGGPDANFQQRQAKVVANIQARISLLQQELACVQSAQDISALRACRENFRAEARKASGNERGGQRGGQPEGQPEGQP